jgi:2-polyprenyl-3-methyl-5-hydroxy-6-metoxy-1,4-benzoquinol methylase
MKEHLLYKNYSSIQSNAELFSELNKRKPLLDYIIKNYFPINRNVKILDIGCGYGALLYFAQKLGYKNSFGFDISVSQVKISKKLKINNIILSSFENYFKNKKNKYDLIVMLDVIEHLEKKKIKLYLEKIKKFLTTNGRIIIHTNNAVSPFFGNVRYGDSTHQTAFTDNSLEKILRDSNFTLVNFVEDSPKVYNLISFFRFIIWSFFRFLINLIIFSETGKYKNIVSQNFFCIVKNGNRS